jgi:hypothetical protein
MPYVQRTEIYKQLITNILYYGALYPDVFYFWFCYKYYGVLHLLTFGVSQEPDNSE